jgi:hypothetical protein
MRDDPDPCWRLRRCRHLRQLPGDSQRALQRLSSCSRRSKRSAEPGEARATFRTRGPDAMRLCLQARLGATTLQLPAKEESSCLVHSVLPRQILCRLVFEPDAARTERIEHQRYSSPDRGSEAIAYRLAIPIACSSCKRSLMRDNRIRVSDTQQLQ